MEKQGDTPSETRCLHMPDGSVWLLHDRALQGRSTGAVVAWMRAIRAAIVLAAQLARR